MLHDSLNVSFLLNCDGEFSNYGNRLDLWGPIQAVVSRCECHIMMLLEDRSFLDQSDLLLNSADSFFNESDLFTDILGFSTSFTLIRVNLTFSFLSTSGRNSMKLFRRNDLSLNEIPLLPSTFLK